MQRKHLINCGIGIVIGVLAFIWFISGSNTLSNTHTVKDIHTKSSKSSSAQTQDNKNVNNLGNTSSEVLKYRAGTPYEYDNELDFRIIVITYNRAESLRKCLEHVGKVDTLGDRVGVDIWIDRSKAGQVDNNTIQISNEFVDSWKGGSANVHIRDVHAGILGQWIYTWRPKAGTKELALILEDDIDLSPQAYKWIKTVHKWFHNQPNNAGYGLQMENVRIARGKNKSKPLQGPKTDIVFIYQMFATWGAAPSPQVWRDFQDWFQQVKNDKAFHPVVPDIVPMGWYKNFVRKQTHDDMWEMWFIHYCYINKLLTVHPNLIPYTGRTDVFLSINRKEKGLHFPKKLSTDKRYSLLESWNESFDNFPKTFVKYGFDGKPLP